MSLSERLLRSLIRIFATVVTIAAVGLAGLAAALRQPVMTDLPFLSSMRADPRSLERHVRFLTTEVCPRNVSHPENLDRTAHYIAEQFRRTGARTSLHTFEARGRSYSNVVAEFGPTDSKIPLLVVGAHYDAFAETGPLPGADDNASGTAGLLELARLLRSQELQRPLVLIAYANEEPPFFGSDAMGSAVHAKSLAEDGRRISGMICLEMIGYFAPRQNWPNALFALIYPSRGDFIGVAGGWSDRHLARNVKRAIAGAGGVRVVSFSGPRVTSDASDHRNYWNHGWPAVMVTDTAFLRNPHYHTSADRADTLDYRKMASVVDGVLNAILSLCSG